MRFSWVVIVIALNGSVAEAEEFGAKASALAECAAGQPRGMLGIPDQWFEMESAIGWEKMSLIFGYADNQSTCEHLVQIAAAESPDRQFRCSPAN